MKRLTVELITAKLAGQRLLGAIPLSRGGLGLLFEGNKILDLKGYVYDQAEAVNEMQIIRQKMDKFGFLGQPNPEPTHQSSPVPAVAPVDPNEGLPIFSPGWEPMDATQEERDAFRAKRLEPTSAIFDFEEEVDDEVQHS